MKKLLTLSLPLFGLLLSQSAFAECEEQYVVNKVMSDIKKAKTALQESDNNSLVAVGKEIEGKILCLDAPLLSNGQVFEKLYRIIGYGYFYSDDTSEAKKWFSSAQEALPSFRFSSDTLENEDVRQLYEDVRSSRQERQAVEGKILQVPAGTKLYLNGNLVSTADFSKGQYNYAYLISEVGDNIQVQARFSFEDAFPSELLKDDDGSGIYDASMKKVERIRPPEKTPLMILGGITTLTAVGLYGYTFKTNQDFEVATHPDDMRSIQTLNNNLIITAGVVGFVGFGLGYTGVLIDSQGGIRF